MQQLTITIGRGEVGSKRLLDPEQWQAFVEDVKALVIRHGYDLTVKSFGTGEWEGISEQNFAAIGIREALAVPLEINGIISEVAALADLYNQDAIALGFGTSYLIDRDGNGR